MLLDQEVAGDSRGCKGWPVNNHEPKTLLAIFTTPFNSFSCNLRDQGPNYKQVFEKNFKRV
jgi:hypothetical protein